MEERKEETIKALFEAFERFNKTDWCCSPVSGLKRSELFMLISIQKIIEEKKNVVRVTDISRMLGVAPPTVTQMVNNLEKNGYVTRCHDEQDRRAVIVALTEKAMRDMDVASKQFEKFFEGLVEYLGEKKSAELAELLNKVFAYCENFH